MDFSTLKSRIDTTLAAITKFGNGTLEDSDLDTLTLQELRETFQDQNCPRELRERLAATETLEDWLLVLKTAE
ncbi:hypothetical protein ACFL26_00910 [Patescibacteria group bacterium]